MPALGENGCLWRLSCSNRSYWIQLNQDGFSLQFRSVSSRLFEIQYNSGSPPGLNDVDRLEISLIYFDCRTPHCVDSARKIQCNARWRLSGESIGNTSHWLGQVNTNDFRPSLDRSSDCLNGGLRPRGSGAQHRSRRQDALVHPFHYCNLMLIHFFASSCNSSDVVRSIQSPAGSCTISRSWTDVSLMATIRP